MEDEDFVYTASGEVTEFTYGTYEEAFNDVTSHEAWGVVLKHKPYSFEDAERPEEEVVYEHLPHLKR